MGTRAQLERVLDLDTWLRDYEVVLDLS